MLSLVAQIFAIATHMQLRAARSRCRKLRPLRYSMPSAMSTMNLRSVWVGRNFKHTQEAMGRKSDDIIWLRAGHESFFFFLPGISPEDSLPDVNVAGSCAGLRTSWTGEWPWAWGSVLSLPPSKHLTEGTRTDAGMRLGGGLRGLWRSFISLTEQSDDVGMVEVLHTGCLVQELLNLPLGEAVHWGQRGNLTCLAALTVFQNVLSVASNSLFIVFTATFSNVPSCWLNRPSTTEPNSPKKAGEKSTHQLCCWDYSIKVT